MSEAPEPQEQEPRLVAGETNRFFEYQDADAIEHLSRPRTVEGFVRTARQSLVALTVLEHGVFPVDTAADSERRFFADGDKQVVAEEERQGIRHRAGEPRTVRLGIPGTIAHYTEGVNPSTQKFGSLIKVQPEVRIPDLDDENLTEEEQMKLFTDYRRAIQFPTEFSWSSDDPNTVLVQRGQEAVALQDLPVDEVVKVSKFLRNAALWRAFDLGNAAVLDRLQFVDADIPSRLRLPKMPRSLMDE